MKLQVVFLGICLQCLAVQSFIVPDEVPTILSLIYSNIPTIKKGTDSRIGWGFRLGDRADFQVLVELGPQKNTQPIGNQESESNKRNADHNAINVLYAQALAEQQRQQQLQREQQPKKHISKTDGGKWLEQWSDQMKPKKPAPAPAPVRVPLLDDAGVALGVGEIDAKSVIPEDNSRDSVKPIPFDAPSAPKPLRITVKNSSGRNAAKHVQTEPENIVISTTRRATITKTQTIDPKDALDNVDLDD